MTQSWGVKCLRVMGCHLLWLGAKDCIYLLGQTLTPASSLVLGEASCHAVRQAKRVSRQNTEICQEPGTLAERHTVSQLSLAMTVVQVCTLILAFHPEPQAPKPKKKKKKKKKNPKISLKHWTSLNFKLRYLKDTVKRTKGKLQEFLLWCSELRIWL